VTALVTTALQDGPPTTSMHAMAETVLALAAPYFWLIRTFHEKTGPKEREVAVRRGRLRRVLVYVKAPGTLPYGRCSREKHSSPAKDCLRRVGANLADPQQRGGTPTTNKPLVDVGLLRYPPKGSARLALVLAVLYPPKGRSYTRCPVARSFGLPRRGATCPRRCRAVALAVLHTVWIDMWTARA
jgi:hypothetical protein